MARIKRFKPKYNIQHNTIAVCMIKIPDEYWNIPSIIHNGENNLAQLQSTVEALHSPSISYPAGSENSDDPYVCNEPVKKLDQACKAG